MKIIDKDEREAHKAYVLAAGLKGFFYGSLFSAGIYAFLKLRHPGKFGRFNASIKTAILTMPTIASAAFFADEGSVEFDRRMYSSGQTNQIMLEEFRQWKKASATDKIISTVSSHKYEFILLTWLASMYGSWAFVNMDKLTKPLQKLVRASNYAGAITLVLLLTTILVVKGTGEKDSEEGDFEQLSLGLRRES